MSAGQNFIVSHGFQSQNLASFSGSTTVAPPATGNNPQVVDQMVSAANAALTPGVAGGDQKIVRHGVRHVGLGYAVTPVNSNGGGFGFKAVLVTQGSGSGGTQVVIKFISAAEGNATIASYTLGPNMSVAFDAIGASGRSAAGRQ